MWVPERAVGHMSMLAIALSVVPLVGVGCTQADDASWKGYVCKVLDYSDCKAGRKRIYPRSERYSDEGTCFREFEKIYETDPEMDRLYPQTFDPAVSYIFGCARVE